MANVWIRIGGFTFVGVAAIVTGGWAGWLFGVALLMAAATSLVRELRRHA
jgi:hypothetical protein